MNRDKNRDQDINDDIISVIRHVVEYSNRTKRLAQLLSAHYIETVMSRGEDKDTLILDEILLKGSGAGNNGGIAYWRGVLSSIVIQHKKKESKLGLKSLKEIANLSNIENFYFNDGDLINKVQGGYTKDQILQEMIVELNKQYQGLYIGKLGELANRVLTHFGEEVGKIKISDIQNKEKSSIIEKFWRLNKLLPKHDQIEFFPQSRINDSWITITELGLLKHLGSKTKGSKTKQPSRIYLDFLNKNGKNQDQAHQIGRLIQYLFGKKMNRKYVLGSEIDDGTSKYVLGSSFKTDGHSVSVLVYDLKKKKQKNLTFKESRLNLLDLGRTFKKHTKFYSDKLHQDYNPEWIVGVDFGVRYAAGLFAMNSCGTDEHDLGNRRTLTIKTKAVFDPTWRFNKWLLEEKDKSEDNIFQQAGDLKRRNDESLDDFIVRYKELYGKLTLFNNSRAMQRHRAYLWKAKRGEFDRAVNACLKMVGKTIGEKSDGKTCFVFGIIIYFNR